MGSGGGLRPGMDEDHGNTVDQLVVTASNVGQMRGYAAELRSRHGSAGLGQCGHWRIVPDPDGRRIGSGGSTLLTLYRLARDLSRQPQQHGDRADSFEALFARHRALVIHSGGDSRRLPAYAAHGKLFTPLPIDRPDDSPAALFDLILDDLLGIALDEGVLIASGDVLLGVSGLSLDRRGIVGVGWPTAIERGRRHGVYVAGDDGAIVDFLHKAEPGVLRERGAVRADGTVLVDTGLVALDPRTIDHWLTLAGAVLTSDGVELGTGLLRGIVTGHRPGLDLYGDMLASLPGKGRGKPRSDDREGTIDWRGTNAASVVVTPSCDFLHIGSSRELIEVVAGGNEHGEKYGLRPRIRCVCDEAKLDGSAYVWNTIAEGGNLSAKSAALIEACELHGRVALGGRNVLVGMPAGATRAIELPAGWGLVCLPIGVDQWSAVLFGVEDDWKSRCANGGHGTFGNQPMADFLRHGSIPPEDIWPEDIEPTLWDARLWVVGEIDDVLDRTLWMCRGDRPTDAWRTPRRSSMAELVQRVHHRRLIGHRAEIQRRVRLLQLVERLRGDDALGAERVAGDVTTRAEADGLLHDLDVAVEREVDPLLQARVHRVADRIARRWEIDGGRDHAADALLCVSDVLERAIKTPSEPRPAAIQPGQIIRATSPVRIDFAGGWSDTPPICIERGGTVLNGAVTLNGTAPIRAVARLTDRRSIWITSTDLGRSIEITETRQLLDHNDPHHWAALPKAALVLAGVAPADESRDLGEWLDVLRSGKEGDGAGGGGWGEWGGGGGLELTIHADLPKGSGLGTSSILGATILACLRRVLGLDGHVETITRLTSLLEQLMRTGGGWQDQVGGILPGIKLLTTEPGREQTPRVESIALPASAKRELAARSLLYFTGYQRMARDILQNVVGRYLDRDPKALAILKPLKDAAVRMRNDLLAGDIDGFASGVERYWGHKTALDPGATNDTIRALIEPIRGDLSGYELPGAGGGGFLFAIARDESAADRIRQHLTRNPPNDRARFYNVAISEDGLRTAIM